jgi:hypothetical protein
MRTFTLMLAATVTTASFSSGWAAQSGYPEKRSASSGGLR